jgi:hypothetical protein
MKIYLVNNNHNHVVLFASKDKQAQLGYVVKKLRAAIKDSMYSENYNYVNNLLNQEKIEEALYCYNKCFMTNYFERMVLQEIEV